MSRKSLFSVLKLLAFLLVLIICIYVLFNISSNINENVNERSIENFATFTSKYKSTSLIYTSSISNNNWLIDSDIQYVYQSIPDKDTWNHISDIMNANDSSLLINKKISYHDKSGSPIFNPITSIGIIVDPYQKSTISISQLNYETVKAPSGYFIAFTTPQKAMTMECSLDLGGKTIGYFGFTDEVFIDAVLNGHRIDKNSINKRLINENDVDVLSGYISNIDIFITYIIPGSDFHKKLLKQRITFMGFANMDISRVSLFYPGLTMAKDINISSTFLDLLPPNDISNNTATVTQSEKITNLPTMTLQLLLLKPVTLVENFGNKETFITRLELPDSYLDPTYTCYGDITANIKALCDSSYDIIGKPKTRKTTWDHTCLVDTDCPYFQANKNYKNNRGGCMDSGVCELPIGVRRISYRKYDDKDIFAPYCYGCDAYDTECCSKQEKPDYAFANDTNERIESDSKLPISIPLYKSNGDK